MMIASIQSFPNSLLSHNAEPYIEISVMTAKERYYHSHYSKFTKAKLDRS